MRVRNNLGYSDAEYVAEAATAPAFTPLVRTRFVQKMARRDEPRIYRPIDLGVLPGSDLDMASGALPGMREIPFPTPAFVPRGPSPLPTPRLAPRFTPTPVPIPRGTGAGVVNMWKVTPAVPQGYFAPSTPEGAYYPEQGSSGRFRYVPGVSPYRFVPRPRMLPGEAFFRFFFGRGGSTTPSTPSAPSTSAAPASSTLLPAYDLFQPGIFGPGDATTEDPALAQVRAKKEEESRSFPLLSVLLLGGGALLAYRVVRGKGAVAGAKSS